MSNSDNFTNLTLTAYSSPGPLRYLYFLILLCLYLMIIVSNVLLIVVICLNRTLHEPMYIFICSLFVNELCGGISVFPCLLVQILKDVHTISASMCFLQIMAGHSYANVELLTLAVMSYDRYVAICQPLQYNILMSNSKALRLVALTWLLPIAAMGVMVSLTAPLKLCGSSIPKVYCDNYSVVKLACGDTTVNNVYGLLYTCLVLFTVPAVILYTYGRILRVCLTGSKQTRHKAISTCMPHVASLLNFSCGCFFEIVQSRFDMSSVPNNVRIILSLYFLICPPLFNPVMYGLNLTKIRLIVKNLIRRKC